MRIGELAKLTDTPARSLRYYEEQGLVMPRRMSNGYRDYDDHLVDRVFQIRGLLDTGLPTRVIKQILQCLISLGRSLQRRRPGNHRDARARGDRMSQRIDCLIRNRNDISDYLETVR